MRRTYADAIRGTLRSVTRRRISRRLQGLHWAPEDGIALVLSVIVMSVLTIATAGMITAVTSNEHAFGRDRQTNRALNIAEAGLNAGVAAVKALPATATSISPASGSTDGGSWSYSATRTQDSSNPDLYVWTITSTGLSPYYDVTRIVSIRVAETITHHSTTETTTTPASDAYKYGFFLGDPASDCTTASGGNTFSGNYTISASFFVAGSLCISQQNTNVREPDSANPTTLDVYVGKKFKTGGNNTSPIGTSSAPILKATVVGGCLDKNGISVLCSKQGDPTKNSGQAGYGSGVYAASYSSTQISIPKPTVDTNWYSNAKPGPATGCNDDPTHPGNAAYQSTYPAGYTAAQFKAALFDNDGTRNTSLGSIDPMTVFGTSSWDCRYYDSDGNLVGRLAWTYGTPGSLTISGTVWVDGNLNFTSSDGIVSGRGTIYANGTVSFSGQAKLCEPPMSGYSTCQGHYDSNQNIIVLVANNAANANPGFSLTGNSAVVFEGVAFTNGVLSDSGQANLYGPVIADTATMAGNGITRTTVDPPAGAPGAAATTTSTTSEPDTAAFADVPGSWQQLQ
jgi:Tfp pilus assembly protein PilX